MSFSDSFFDENYDQPGNLMTFKLWSKKEPFSDPDDVVWEGSLFKPSKGNKATKLRYFRMTTKFLYCFGSQSDTNAKGAMNLNFVRVEYFTSEQFPHSKFGIKFFKNLKFFNLYSANQAEYQAFKRTAASLMTQSDFHQKFNVIKMIGKGSFAKVSETNEASFELRLIFYGVLGLFSQ